MKNKIIRPYAFSKLLYAPRHLQKAANILGGLRTLYWYITRNRKKTLAKLRRVLHVAHPQPGPPR